MGLGSVLPDDQHDQGDEACEHQGQHDELNAEAGQRICFGLRQSCRLGGSGLRSGVHFHFDHPLGFRLGRHQFFSGGSRVKYLEYCPDL